MNKLEELFNKAESFGISYNYGYLNEACVKFLEKNSQNEKVLIYQAFSNIGLGNYEKSFSDLNKVLEINSNSIEANRVMALLYREKGEIELARKYFIQSFELAKKISDRNSMIKLAKDANDTFILGINTIKFIPLVLNPRPSLFERRGFMGAVDKHGLPI